MVALIDADIVAYRAASVSEEDIDWQDGSYGKTLSSQQAKDSARHIIQDWMNKAQQTSVALCWTSADNFRKEIDPNYKANRTGERPDLLEEVTEWLKVNYHSYAVNRLEADDVMSIYHTAGTNSVIVSIDKDMQTVPGMVFNPDKDRRPRRITVGQADRFWMLQTLMGDRADGIKGIPRVGPKKAEAILASTRSNLPDLWSAVVTAYKDAGLTEEDAVRTAQLVRILRAEDYHNDKKEISVWHPTTPTLISLITPETSNPSTSSSPSDSDSTKETSSSTSADGDEKEESKTSAKRKSTLKGSSRSKPKRKTKTRKATSSRGIDNEVA